RQIDASGIQSQAIHRCSTILRNGDLADVGTHCLLRLCDSPQTRDSAAFSFLCRPLGRQANSSRDCRIHRGLGHHGLLIHSLCLVARSFTVLGRAPVLGALTVFGPLFVFILIVIGLVRRGLLFVVVILVFVFVVLLIRRFHLRLQVRIVVILFVFRRF